MRVGAIILHAQVWIWLLETRILDLRLEKFKEDLREINCGFSMRGSSWSRDVILVEFGVGTATLKRWEKGATTRVSGVVLED